MRGALVVDKVVSVLAHMYERNRPLDLSEVRFWRLEVSRDAEIRHASPLVRGET